MKSIKVNPKDVPIMMLGGSPHIVAEPPRFAQKISERIIGTGLNSRSLESSMVTAARNRITVILSMNMASTKDNTMKVIKIGMTWYFTSFARRMQSQRKNPTLAIPSTIIIIPAMKMIVCQLMPEEASEDSPAAYQKAVVKMLFTFSVSQTALMLRIPSPNTRTSVSRPQPRVIRCLSHTSRIIRTNMARNMISAKNLCCHLFFPLLLLYFFQVRSFQKALSSFCSVLTVNIEDDHKTFHLIHLDIVFPLIYPHLGVIFTPHTVQKNPPDR